LEAMVRTVARGTVGVVDHCAMPSVPVKNDHRTGLNSQGLVDFVCPHAVCARDGRVRVAPWDDASRPHIQCCPLWVVQCHTDAKRVLVTNGDLVKVRILVLAHGQPHTFIT
jgi:hypothetical protein